MERLPEHQSLDAARSGRSGEAAPASSRATGCITTSGQTQTIEPRARITSESKSFRLSPLALLPPIETLLHQRPPSALSTTGTATPGSRVSRASSHVPKRSPSVSTLTSTSTSLPPSKALSSSASISTSTSASASASGSASTSTNSWKSNAPRSRLGNLIANNRTSGAYTVGIHTMNNVRTGLPRWTHGVAERMQAGEWEWERGWADAGVERQGQRQGGGNKDSEKKCVRPIEKPIEKPAEKPSGKKRGDGRESRGRLMRLFSGRNK